MHDGYFVGRKELTAWIQSSFNPAFQKVEDLANGVVYCQIINSVYPGALPMAKVKMDARTEVDCLHNFKLLQTAFNKKKVDRYIEVDKLTKRSEVDVTGATRFDPRWEGARANLEDAWKKILTNLSYNPKEFKTMQDAVMRLAAQPAAFGIDPGVGERCALTFLAE